MPRKKEKNFSKIKVSSVRDKTNIFFAVYEKVIKVTLPFYHSLMPNFGKQKRKVTFTSHVKQNLFKSHILGLIDKFSFCI